MQKYPYLFMQVIIATLMRLQFINTAIAFTAQIAVKGFAGFAGGFGLVEFSSVYRYIFNGIEKRARRDALPL